MKKTRKKQTKVVKFQATLNPNKKCISIDGDGAASMTLDTDGTQLAKVLTALADMKGSLIEVTLKPLANHLQNKDGNGEVETYR